MAKQKKQEELRYNTPLLWMFLFLCPLVGGYYVQSAFFLGAMLVVCLFLEISTKQHCMFPEKKQAYPLCALLLGYLIAIPFSVSQGMAWVGFLRLVVWVMMYGYTLSLSKKERFFVIDALTYEAAFFSVGYSMAFVSDVVAGRENLNGRVDGLFQYANAWGVYLLCCFVWLLYRCLEENNGKAPLFASVSLLVGIFFTGSRATLLLTLGAVIYVIVTEKENNVVKKYGKKGMILLILSFFFVNLGMGGLLTFRLSQFTLESSSLNGRLLYWMDGLSMLLEHPFGVGRGGYLYLQPVYQTGIYTTHYVHNEYLQMALEGGVVAGFAFLFFVISVLSQKTLEKKQKVILWILAIHMVVDFDTPFFFLLCFLTLVGAEEGVIKKVEKKGTAYGFLGILMAVFSFFTLVYQQSYLGNHSLAYGLYPYDLSLAENQLLTCDNPKEVAEQIRETTDLSLLMWDYYSKYGSEEERIRGNYAYLELQKYNKESYQNLINQLNQYKADYPELVVELAEKSLLLLEETIEKTSPFAYRIYDAVDFSWGDEMKEGFRLLLEES